MLTPTTTSEPPNIAQLTRSRGNLSSEFLAFEGRWSGMGVRRVRGGAAADRHSTMMRASEVAVGDAGSNHHFRAAKHCVLDTLLGQSKLRITLGGRVESHAEVRGFGGGGGAAADRHSTTMMRVSGRGRR